MKVVLANSVETIPMKPIDGNPTLVYWNIVGLARPIRFVLALAGVDDLVDVRIEVDSFDSWVQAKSAMMKDNTNFAFPNLPYYMDGTITVTQSDAILRYLGRKYNLMGVPGQEHIVDMVLDQLKDINSTMTKHCYESETSVLKSYMVETMIPCDIQRFEKILHGKKYVTGDIVSVADIKLFSHLLKVERIQSDIGIEEISSWLSDNPNLDSFFQRMKQLPALQSYLEGPINLDRPMNSSEAKNPFA